MKNGIKNCARCKAYTDTGCFLNEELELTKPKTWFNGWHMNTSIHKPKSGKCYKPLTLGDLRIWHNHKTIFASTQN